MKALPILTTAIFLAIATSLHAQQTQPDTTQHKKHTHMMNGVEMNDDDMMMMDMGSMQMNSQFSLDLPMNRDGSGTSWVPDESPMYAYMIHGKKWMTMIHGNFFLRYNNQDIFKSGSRGGQKFDVPNMIMAMTQTKVGSNGLFAINTMFSADPFLVGPGGYPLLYQTGESYKGNKLVDRQHPHDFFAELNVAYTQRVAKQTDITASFGFPGEPALGPPVFMHRLSGMNDPNAPLSHHYQDATHITFGVATLGFRYRDIKVEGSVFTGREPDEFRYNFDQMKFDSYSFRVSYNPSKQWALQVSDGYIRSPEEAEPAQNVNRFTASAMNTKVLGDDSYIATTLVYGQNHYLDNSKTLPSILLESSLQHHRAALYGRYEYVQKDAEELDMHAAFPANPNFSINAFTLGTSYILSTLKSTNLTLGVQGTVDVSPSPLKNYYGAAPLSVQVYLRISPSMMKRHHM
ncbi:MAG TPA: hypothetical protein VIQ77_12910 [Mucilaginibacter sp.]